MLGMQTPTQVTLPPPDGDDLFGFSRSTQRRHTLETQQQHEHDQHQQHRFSHNSATNLTRVSSLGNTAHDMGNTAHDNPTLHTTTSRTPSGLSDVNLTDDDADERFGFS
eukprot:m.231513 g.231513  ORF g.231513 m.231513 type:complete len:109 (+) comp33602_c1_seq1:2083-2409(+)